MTQELVLRGNDIPASSLQEPFPVELPSHIQVLVLAHYDDPDSLGHAQTQICFLDKNADPCFIPGFQIPEQLRLQLVAIGDFLRTRVRAGGESFLLREDLDEDFGAKIRYELRENGSIVAKIFTDHRGDRCEFLLDADGNFLFSGKVLKIQDGVRGSLQGIHGTLEKEL